MKSLLFPVLLALALTVAIPTRAADEASPKLATYIYVLRLVERLHADEAWTPADKEAVGRHFARLQAATASGQVVFAGRTMESGRDTFGVVVFEAASADAARQFAQDDPAVGAQVMTVDVRPFALVLERSKPAQ